MRHQKDAQNGFSEAGLEAPVRRLALLKLLSELENDLSVAKIPFLLLKGLAFELSFYPENLRRDSSDIDLFVNMNDLEVVRELLEDRGFSLERNYGERELAYEIKTQHALCFVRESGEEVDVHWRLIQDQFSLSDRNLDMFQDSVGFQYQGISFKTPSREKQFLIMVIQAYKSGWQDLKYLVDMEYGLTSEKLDFDKVVELAKRAGLEEILNFNMAILSRVWGRPTYPLLRHSGERNVERILSRLESSQTLSEFERLKLEFSLRVSLLEKFKFFLKRSFVPHEKDWDLELPQGLFFVYFLVKPVRVFFKGLKGALGL